METTICLVLLETFTLAVIVYQFVAMNRERVAWVKERTTLLNRIMARSYDDYHVAKVHNDHIEHTADQNEDDDVLTPSEIKAIEDDEAEEERKKRQLFGYDNEYQSPSITPGAN